jgi:hypothetical protein
MTDFTLNELETIQTDLARGTFLSKWPNWIRWILFLPSAVFIPILFYMFQYLMQTWFLDIGPDAFLLVISRSIIYGGGFVLAGSMVAPKGQKIIAIILMIIMAMLVGAGTFAAVLNRTFMSTLVENLVILASAGYTTYYVFKET